MSISASPSTISTVLTTPVTITGTGTSWLSGVTFTVSGVTGASIVSKTVVSDTEAVLLITTSTSTGTLTITDTTDTLTTTIAVGLVLQAIPNVLPASTTTTVILVCNGAGWVSAPTVTVSGVSGTSIGSVTLINSSMVSAPITTGATSGTLTITDTTDTLTTTVTVSSSSQADAAVSSGAIWAWGIETIQGVPVAVTNAFDADFAGNTFEYNPGLKDVTLMTGTPNNTVAYVRANGTVRLAIQQPLSPSLVSALFPNIGFLNNGGTGTPPDVSNLRQPKSLTILTVIRDPDGNVFDVKQFAGCRAGKVTINGSYDNVTMVIIEFEGTVAPITADAPSNLYPTYDDPYTWSEWVTPTLLGGSTNVDCENWSIVFDWGLDSFYGGGKNLPTRNAKSKNLVTGTLTPLHTPTEYDAFANNARGTMLFTFSRATPSHSLSIILPNCAYTAAPIDASADHYVTDQVSYAAIARVLGSSSPMLLADPAQVTWA